MMNRKFTFSHQLFTLLIVGIALMFPNTSFAEQVSSNEKFNQLQSLLDKTITSGLPGISMAIANKNGIVWSGASGWYDREEKISISKDHLFGIGSITKTFVAVVILQLAEEGLINLNATAEEILGIKVTQNIANTEKATILQLLNHTAGVPTWEFDKSWIRHGRGKLMTPDKVWGKSETLGYLNTNNPAQNFPGEKYNYSNTHHTLLGLIIEKVTGNNASDEIRKRVLIKANTPNIYLDGFESYSRERLARGYHIASKEFIENAGIHPSFPTVTPELIKIGDANLSVEWSAGGMVAKAADLALFAQELKQGHLLDSRSMAILMDYRAINDSSSEVGHGLFRQTIENYPPVIGHSGGVLGYAATMNWFEDGEITWVVLMNLGHMHAGSNHGQYSAGKLLRDKKLSALLLEIDNATKSGHQ
jgi:D-alanyl-D-alanine carboxypeptidase